MVSEVGDRPLPLFGPLPGFTLSLLPTSAVIKCCRHPFSTAACIYHVAPGVVIRRNATVRISQSSRRLSTALSRSRRLVPRFALGGSTLIYFLGSWPSFARSLVGRNYCVVAPLNCEASILALSPTPTFHPWVKDLRKPPTTCIMSSLPTRRDYWPPTQMRLHSSVETDDDDALLNELDASFIDDDPLNYFLTPAPSSQDDDVDMELDLDAGIDSPNRKSPVVRSVSPSSLDSKLTGLPLRPPTPPRSCGSRSPEPDLDMAPTPEDEDDGESYLRFGSSPLTPPFDMPFSLRDLADIRHKANMGGGRRKGKTAPATLLSPAPAHGSPSSGRGRLSHRPGPRPLAAAAMDTRGRTRSWSGRLSPHAWREPSPDVWSIEEEAEEDVVDTEMGDSAASVKEARAIDIPPAKPKKRVRFVFPVQEVV